MASDETSVSSLHRAVQILRALAASAAGGSVDGAADGSADGSADSSGGGSVGGSAHHGQRVSDLGKALGFTQSTTHRLLQQLVDEGLVTQVSASKRYALSLDFFALAASAGAGAAGGLRERCRPALLRLGAALGDSVFLLVRAGFDALCLDRWEGPFPIRSFTGDVGGRVPLGVGQGALAILAHLPEAERDEVMRYNVPRIRYLGGSFGGAFGGAFGAAFGGHQGGLDEVFLRTAINTVRAQGFANTNAGLIDGMAGVAVPVFDANGQIAAALSIGTLTARLDGDRLPVVVGLLQREANALVRQINPFDRVLRRPVNSLA